jgi:hypothetical protein
MRQSIANRAVHPPRRPQAWQVNRGSRSDRRTLSGHRSPLISIEWLHR